MKVFYRVLKLCVLLCCFSGDVSLCRIGVGQENTRDGYYHIFIFVHIQRSAFMFWNAGEW